MTTEPDYIRCAAKTSSGHPCRQRPIRGGTVCYTHGGSAPQVRRKADERLVKLAAARQVSEWGGRLDVTPPEALLELVQGKAAEVAYWNRLVADLEERDRAGLLLAKTEVGEGPQGPVDTETRQAGPHVYLVMLHKAQDQLAAYSAAAIRAGVDEAMVRVAAVQAAAVVELVRRAIDAARTDLKTDPDAILLALIGGVR